MSDDPKKQGKADRSRVAAKETYEVDYFAQKHGISQDEAQALIDRVGNDRAKLDAAVVKSDRLKTAARGQRPRPGVAKTNTTKAGGSSSVKPPTKSARSSKLKAARKSPSSTAKEVKPIKAPALSAARETTRAGSAAVKRRAASTSRAVKTAAQSATSSAAGSRTASLIGAVAAGVVTGLAANLSRKVAVQAPSLRAGDWFEALKVEHKLALTLLDKLQATSGTHKAKRSNLLAQLKHALSKHAFAEENIIYPALRNWGDKADADKLSHDHSYVKQALYDLEVMDKASAEFVAKVVDLKTDLEAHIHEEETAIFPRLHRELGEATNAKITAMANQEGFKLA